MWSYTSVIRFKITYAAMIWQPKINQRELSRSSTKIQMIACRSVPGASKPCVMSALEIILGFTSLSIHIKGVEDKNVKNC